MTIFHNSTIVLDNFFRNPLKVIELGNSLNYTSSEVYPGYRTANLLELDGEAIEFAKFFAKEISSKILHGVTRFNLDLRFHKNQTYTPPEANFGWTHNDDVDYAGLIYLNPSELDLTTGTTICDKKDNVEFAQGDIVSRKNFNVTAQGGQQYLDDLKINQDQFVDTIQVGNKFNRLIGYDARQWHKPTNYNVVDSPRFTLLFFIEFAEVAPIESPLQIQSNWKDQ
jgi:hypothetical protein